MRSRRTEQIIMGCVLVASIFIVFSSAQVNANPLHDERNEYRLQKSTNVIGSPANTAG